MIKLIIDSNKNLKKAATSKVFVGENEFEEITVSCNRRVLVNNIPDFSASLRVVIGENELSYPLAFSDTDSNTMTATVLIDTRMTRAVAELQFYVKFNSGEKVGMTNAIKIECKPNIESNGDEPYIPPIPLDDFVPRAQTIAGIDQYDAITAEELKAALDIEVSDGAKVFFEIFAPPYYVSDNDYCKIGDIWVDKEISTGQGYRVSVLMSKIYISDPGVYYCSWQPVVPASFNINVLPGGGNLPVHCYSETGGNTEYSYPPYRNGDILTVNGSDYECSVSDGSSYSSTYTYSFKRAVSEADITGKMSLIPIDPTVEEIEAMPSGQLYGDTTNHKGVIKGGQEFYDTVYIDINNAKVTVLSAGSSLPVYIKLGNELPKQGDVFILYDRVLMVADLQSDFLLNAKEIVYKPIGISNIDMWNFPESSGTRRFFENKISFQYLDGEIIRVKGVLYKVHLTLDTESLAPDGVAYTYTFDKYVTDGYTKTEIDSMIGNVESLLAEV